MQNTRSFALILILVLSSSLLLAQESSSQTTHSSQSADLPRPTPTPEHRKRRFVPEVDDAMAKGEDLLFKKHDARASVDEFKRAAKLDPWYGQAYMLLGLAR
ncbi:MAG: hypothetical protein JWN42_2694, partial [Candidatus Angelobacter sp.]|nr:hypothetical protein [Candidatus Angelobacter sp.]